MTLVGENKSLIKALNESLFNSNSSFRPVDGKENWSRILLSDIAKKITTKNKDGRIVNVISNSAQLGLVPQSEFFDKEIANGENTSEYYIISDGDFVYNPRKSVIAPYGPVNIYKGQNLGIVSPLYLCFKVENVDRDFLFYYFQSKAWHRFIYSNGDSGARHDRVSIKDNVFLSIPLLIPNMDMQEKIVNFLNLLMERLRLEKNMLYAYQKQKNFFLKDMFI